MAFSSTLPPELRATALKQFGSAPCGASTAENGELLAFLAQKAPDWAATQTTAPTNLQALPQRSDAIALSWTPIAYGDDGGAYEVEIADAEAGPFTLHGRTIDKRTPGYTAEGLAPNTTYYFRVRTVMPPHGDQRNTLTSPYTGVVSATTTTAATAGDSYESDDRCADVRALVTDGRTVNHTFHQPGDQDWVQFTTQVSVTYRIDVQPTAGSPADVVLKLYDSCADSEPVTLDQSFSPGVQFTFVAPQSGVVYLQLTNADNTVSGSDVAYQLAVRAVDGESGSGAVILVAGRLFSSDDLQANIEFVIQRLYQTLLDNGYQADDIYYLSNDSSNAGVDAPATVADLRYAITTWAKNRITDAYGLTLYLMDHGDQGLFYIDDSKGERLTPAQLDDWLTELETVAPNAPINLFIEACYSGSFISGSPQSISKPGRVVITSTNLHNLAFASAEGAYFSDHLLTALRQGHHLFSGFWEARIATRQVTSLQQDPWLDADGDGVPNELEDAAIAARRTLFAPTILATSTLWPPYIATIQETTGSDGQRRVQADVRDNGAITRVWAVIYPPGYVPPASGNELAPETLDNVNLTLEGNRYVLPAASFTQPGNYRVVIHAEDADGLRARPAVITINPTGPLGGGNLSGNNVVYLPLVNHQ
ncbi:MAG: fibronectin type III domain-containing protein [Caldilineaceae bacterium]